MLWSTVHYYIQYLPNFYVRNGHTSWNNDGIGFLLLLCAHLHFVSFLPTTFPKILCPLSLKKVWNRNFLLRYSSIHWVLISYIFKKFHAAVNNRTNWLIDWLNDYVKNSIPLQLVAWVKITSWPIFHVQMLIHSFIIPHAQCKYSLTHWRSWKKIDKQKLWSAGIYTMMS